MKMEKLISKQGYEIPYVFEGSGDEDLLVIISHGFGSSKESTTATTVAEKLKNGGIASVRYDFPAHGESPAEGEDFRIENCLKDLQSVEEMVRECFPEKTIGYFSSSFGAFINLLYLSSRKPTGKMSFLRCSAVDMPGIVDRWMEDEDLLQEMKDKGYVVADEGYVKPLHVYREFWDALKKIDLFRDFRKPEGMVLRMIHGTADETAPFTDAAAFAEKFGISLIPVEGADHSFTVNNAMDIVRAKALEFYKESGKNE